MIAVELVVVKKLICSCESSWNEDAKIGILGLSVAQVLPEKIKKMLSPNNLGFIDVNQTVRMLFFKKSFIMGCSSFFRNRFFLKESQIPGGKTNVDKIQSHCKIDFFD